jgi:hypothetical protein
MLSSAQPWKRYKQYTRATSTVDCPGAVITVADRLVAGTDGSAETSTEGGQEVVPVALVAVLLVTTLLAPLIVIWAFRRGVKRGAADDYGSEIDDQTTDRGTPISMWSAATSEYPKSAKGSKTSFTHLPDLGVDAKGSVNPQHYKVLDHNGVKRVANVGGITHLSELSGQDPDWDPSC